MIRLLLLVAVVVGSACESRPQRFPLGFDRMRDQPRYNTYRGSQYFADGKVMQTPPGGTVPIDGGVESETQMAADAAATVIPVPITAAGIARGRNRYDIFCAPCHDLDGSADSPVARNLQLRHPPSLLEPRLRQLPVGRIYRVISEGYGLMPSYERQLAAAERWDVVAYVRALQLRSSITLARLPASMQAEASRALGGAQP